MIWLFLISRVLPDNWGFVCLPDHPHLPACLVAECWSMPFMINVAVASFTVLLFVAMATVFQVQAAWEGAKVGLHLACSAEHVTKQVAAKPTTCVSPPTENVRDLGLALLVSRRWETWRPIPPPTIRWQWATPSERT